MLSKTVLATFLALSCAVQAQEQEKENATDFAVEKLNAEIARDPLVKPLSGAICRNLLDSDKSVRMVMDIEKMEVVAAVDAITSFAAYARLVSEADVSRLTPLEIGRKVTEYYSDILIEIQSQCIYQLALQEIAKDKANWEANFTKRIEEVLFTPMKQAIQNWRTKDANATQKFGRLAAEYARELVNAHAPKGPIANPFGRATVAL